MKIISTHFPSSQGERILFSLHTIEHASTSIVDKVFSLAIENMCGENVTSLPDDVPGRVLGTILLDLREKLTKFLITCLRNGSFSKFWKVAYLVLILKPGKKRWIPHRRLGRPMCHLIEEAKVFERIVAYKITLHLSRIGTGISENQFGYQTGRSSIDAIDMVANYDQTAVTQGGVAPVLLIDIVNTFNSVP